MQYTAKQIEEMHTRFRANFINSLSGFKSVVLIGTKSEKGNSNLAIFSSLFHLGANPPLVGFIVRPDVSPRHTLQNILETKYFTINHLNESIYVNGHQTSARYDDDVNEFEQVKLTEEYNADFYAPFVKESFVKFGCEFQQKIDLAINGTILIIGKIVVVEFPNEALYEDGHVDLEIAGTITCAGLDNYYQVEQLQRLTYAKPDVWPSISSVKRVKSDLDDEIVT